jgi:outer membrane immunogenic protein
MKNFALGMLAAVAMTGSASAADLAARPYTKAPPVIPIQVTNWTGLFVGGEGGGAWGSDRLFFPTSLTTTNSFDTSGGIAGGVVGYNYQAPGSNWVFGVEGNFDWANITGSAVCPNIVFNCRTKIDSIYTGTGRLGYAWDRVMLYGKGGYAWAHGRADVVVPATGAINDGSGVDRDGYTLGAGLEYMFAPNWSAKVEYDYYHFNSKRVNGTSPAGAFIELIDVASRDLHAVKGGINYHFNWGAGPVVARY